MPSPNTHTYDLGDGWTARAGRTDMDNDLLTFKDAFPQDYWFHVKGCPGSHVVLHHDSEHEAPKAILEAAGRIAIKHSKAKNAPKAAVTLARIADLQKPRRAPAGQVTVRKSTTLNIKTLREG
jgi:predicted ribosome quality control (RQC) complex YloA/Tae2 family protein